MSDDLLLAAVKAVPMRCADCGETTATEAECPDGAVRGQRVRVHAFETDDAAIVRAVRAWLREWEPNREDIARIACAGEHLGIDICKNGFDEADAVRALYRRAWEVKP